MPSGLRWKREVTTCYRPENYLTLPPAPCPPALLQVLLKRISRSIRSSRSFTILRYRRPDINRLSNQPRATPPPYRPNRECDQLCLHVYLPFPTALVASGNSVAVIDAPVRDASVTQTGRGRPSGFAYKCSASAGKRKPLAQNQRLKNCDQTRCYGAIRSGCDCTETKS